MSVGSASSIWCFSGENSQSWERKTKWAWLRSCACRGGVGMEFDWHSQLGRKHVTKGNVNSTAPDPVAPFLCKLLSVPPSTLESKASCHFPSANSDQSYSKPCHLPAYLLPPFTFLCIGWSSTNHSSCLQIYEQKQVEGKRKTDKEGKWLRIG